MTTQSLLVAMRLRGTPVPIPNTTVKTCTADGTTLETVWESRWPPASPLGDVAQLGEHLPCKQGVESSNLFVSIRTHGFVRTGPGLIAQPVRAHA